MRLLTALHRSLAPKSPALPDSSASNGSQADGGSSSRAMVTADHPSKGRILPLEAGTLLTVGSQVEAIVLHPLQPL